MRLVKTLLGFAGLAMISACTGSNSTDVLTSAVQPKPITAPQQTSVPAPVAFAEPVTVTPSPRLSDNVAFATTPEIFTPPPRIRAKKTYLINGLASNIGNIGYGFTNLSKKIPGSTLHNYTSFVESSTVIRSRVTKELKAAYKADPDLEINLIGISFGANIVTIIAQELRRSKIPVNYLATLDGPAMLAIGDNVRVTDNFTCTGLNCFRTDTRLAWGNRETEKESFKLKTSHIPLANHPQVHSRILEQINRPLEPEPEAQEEINTVLQ